MKPQKHTIHIQKTGNPRKNATPFIIIGVAAITIFVLSLVWWTTRSTIPADFVPQVEGAPSVAVVSAPVIEHGDLVVNQFVTSTFEIQNVGDETLVLLSPWVEVHEGCCPPVAEISKQQLLPGEIATVSMRYTMHEGMDGEHDLRIHLRSNDPANPEIQLTALSNWVSG
jgi:hypothetical protein